MKLCLHLKRPAPRRKPFAGWNSNQPRSSGATSNNVPKDTPKPKPQNIVKGLGMAAALITAGRSRGRG